jgi:hypothetical protein
MSKKPTSPFAPEFVVYNFLAAFIGFAESVMEQAGWVMSPSRGYLALYEIIKWFRDRKLWHFDQPAFLWVMEEIEARVEALQGTSTDEDLIMEMDKWRDRPEPIPGGVYSVFQIFDWFMPIFRRMESAMVRYYGNPYRSEGGKEISKYEALDIVFIAVDRLYKDKHFGDYNNWGQMKAYPWVRFIREEMREWHSAWKPGAQPLQPGYKPPFSTP